MTAEPRISVIIAVYNGARYLPQELDSILPQLADGDEVLLLDDGSQDGSQELISAYAEKWPQVHLIEQGHVGVIQNFARGIAQARGEFIFLADQDDVWMPDKVRKVCGCLEGQEGPALLLHDAAFTDAEGRETGSTLFQWRQVKTGFWKNWLKNSYTGCCMAFNRKLKLYVLPIPENIPMHDQWIGMLAEHYGKVTLLPERLVAYRRHEAAVTDDHHKGFGQMLKSRMILGMQYIKRMKQGGTR